MEVSYAVGSVVVIVSLIEFFVHRRTFNRNQQNSSGRRISDTMKSPCAMEDRWIIFRFIAAFVVLRYEAPFSCTRLFAIFFFRLRVKLTISSVFEVWIIVFQILQSDDRNELAQAKEPDLSMDGIKSDVLIFIPGVTTSAGCFILFGTTAPLRNLYKSWFKFLTPGRLCTCCFVGKRRHRQEQGQHEQGLYEIGQHSMAELALGSARVRTGTAENSFVDVWPENPNFITNQFMSSVLLTGNHHSAEFNSLTAGASSGNTNIIANMNRNTIGQGGLTSTASDIAGPNPFSLILPSPPATTRSPVEVNRSESTSPSLLQQQERLMRGDAVFFTPHYFKRTGQNAVENRGSDDAIS